MASSAPTIKFRRSRYTEYKAGCRDCLALDHLAPNEDRVDIKRTARKHAMLTGHVVTIAEVAYFNVGVEFPIQPGTRHLAECPDCEATVFGYNEPGLVATELAAQAAAASHSAQTGHHAYVEAESIK